jgi:large subunit ribosomal protein L4
MEISLYATEHLGEQGIIHVAEAVFAKKFNEPLIHQVVTAYLARGRAGTRAQKTRAQVSGGGSKPWRQKGTGRARAGSIRSPLWRGGGVTFAAQPNDYAQKVNKKMYRGAVCSILSELLRQTRLRVVNQLTLTSPKTRELIAQLRALNITLSMQTNVLIVIEEETPAFELAARNLPYVTVCSASRVDPVSLVRAEQVLMTVAAVKIIEARLQKTSEESKEISS